MRIHLFEKLKSTKIWQRFDYFNLANSYLFYYFFIFGFGPILIFLRTYSKILRTIIGQNIPLLDSLTILYLFLGIFCFILGYLLSPSKLVIKKIPNILKREWDSKKIPCVFAVVFILNLIIKLITILGGGYFHLNKNSSFTRNLFYSAIGLLNWLGPISLVIAFIYYFQLRKIGRHYQIWQRIAYGVFGFEFVYGFFSGSKFSAIVPIITYLLVKHYIYSRSLKGVIIAFFLILFLLMPVQNLYKYYLISGNFHYFITKEAKINSKISVIQFIINNSIARLDQSQIVALVFRKTDKFFQGTDLVEFFMGPPRFIWKNKPLSINNRGNEFGHWLGILEPDDSMTSIAPTIIGDWYMNFGLWGIIFGMLFFGAIFRIIFESLIKKTTALSSGVMVYSLFWTQIIAGMEGWIAPAWAGMVKLFIILLIIHFFISSHSNYENSNQRLHC